MPQVKRKKTQTASINSLIRQTKGEQQMIKHRLRCLLDAQRYIGYQTENTPLLAINALIKKIQGVSEECLQLFLHAHDRGVEGPIGGLATKWWDQHESLQRQHQR